MCVPLWMRKFSFLWQSVPTSRWQVGGRVSSGPVILFFLISVQGFWKLHSMKEFTVWLWKPVIISSTKQIRAHAVWFKEKHEQRGRCGSHPGFLSVAMINAVTKAAEERLILPGLPPSLREKCSWLAFSLAAAFLSHCRSPSHPWPRMVLEVLKIVSWQTWQQTSPASNYSVEGLSSLELWIVSS